MAKKKGKPIKVETLDIESRYQAHLEKVRGGK